MRTSPAARRQKVGCGGLLLPSTNRSFDRTFGLPRIHPTLFRTAPSPT